MKLFYVLIILLIFNNCSFDNKTGIWKDEKKTLNQEKKETNSFIELNKILLREETFNKEINLDKSYSFKISPPVNNYKWNDLFYSESNNLDNFSYSNLHEQIFKSRKLSRVKINNYILFSDKLLIASDEKGDIIIYSTTTKKIINKFNFYKKKYKNLKKNLNLFVDRNIVFVSDNMGYLYSYDIRLDKIIWAKNYKIPFRSNLKIQDNKIFASNLNNDLLIFDKISGDLIKQIPSEPTIIKNKFINNFAVDEGKTLFFLNSYGSLYAIDLEVLDVKWFVNLNSSFDLNPSNLFMSNQIIYKDKKIIISSQYHTYIIDSNSGAILYKNNFTTKVRPIINNNYMFLISRNNFLISLDLIDFKILYSYNIDKKIAKFLDIQKKEVKFKSFMMADNNLLMFLNNSYVLNFDIKGDITKIKKLKFKINTNPIFIDKLLLYIDKKNRLILLN